MAGFFTDYSNNRVLDLFLGGVTYSPLTTLYIGLSQNAAVKNGTIVEPSGGGYARVVVPNNASSFPVASNGTKANGIPIIFPAASAAWGTIKSVFVADASSGGNVLIIADLVTPKTIVAGGTPATIAPGALFLSHT